MNSLPATLPGTAALAEHAQPLADDYADIDILLVDGSAGRAQELARQLNASSLARILVAADDPLADLLAGPPHVLLLSIDDIRDAAHFLRQMRSHSVLRHIPALALVQDQKAVLCAKLRELDVQAVITRSARPEQVMAQVAGLRDATAVCPERARNRDQCYELLLNSMDDGFCIVKVLFDDAGRALDYRFLLVNTAFERNTGLQGAQGKLMRRLAPAHEEHWFELYGQVAKTGEPLHFERRADQLHRWYEVNAIRYGRPDDHEVAIFFKDITGRKRAEDERQKTAGMLQVAMRLGRAGAWSLDVATEHVEWTAEARAIHELPEDFKVNLEAATALVEDGSRPYLEAAVEACISKGQPFDLEARAWTFHRKPLWIRLIGEAVRDASGAIVRVQGAVQDITDLTKASKEARDLSDQLSETLESMTDGFFTLSEDGRFLYINGRAERLVRHSRAELIGKSIWEVAPHLVGTPMERALQHARDHFTPVETEFYSQRLATWLAMRFCPSERGMAVYLRDISEEKHSALALVASQEHYRLLFETSLDGILQTTLDGFIVRANPSACRMFGLGEAEMCGLHKASLVAAGDMRMDALALQRARTGSARGEVTALRADGSSFEADILSVEYKGSSAESGTYIVLRDISERKRAEHDAAQAAATLAQRVRERTAELELANRELKEFSQALAHDVRGPIAAISAFANALERDLASGQPRRVGHYVDRILKSVERVNEYTEALLSLVRLSHVQMNIRKVDLSALAQEILGNLRALEPHRQVAATVQPALTATGDPVLLRMVLQNLLANAWKFTSKKKQATISFTLERRPNGSVVYQVRDNGAGFDMAYQSRLFTTFRRLHSEEEFPGTGIGLANVHRIIARHGGRVWAEGLVDRGATFFFTLGASQG
jgi:PAS domain S-box-containing protein